MPQKHPIAAALLLFSLCIVCGAAPGLANTSSSNFRVFSSPPPAEDMILHDLRGRNISLSGLRGKAVILNFWKIDCPPCSAEKPILERIYRKYAGRGLEIVAVNLSDPADQIQAYVQRGGYSFTFAFDPSNRFSLKRHNVGPGIQTTVVVNPRSEAIYEIPGVPTTYVIDRRGHVVGNSVGMVNWEDPEMLNILESLVQPALRTASPQESAKGNTGIRTNEPNFAESAGKVGRSHETGAQVRFASAAGPEEISQFSGQGSYPATLAQQGPNYPVPVGPEVELQRPPQATTVNRPQPASRKPVASGGAKKPATDARAKQPAAAKQVKPGTTATAGRGNQSGYSVSQQQPGASPLAQTGTGAPMPQQLPPAMPYTPSPRDQAPRGPLIPDDNGAVTARIPGDYGPSGSNLPAAQQVARPNAIGGFILDSFGIMSSSRQSSRPISAQRPQVEQPTQQPANIFQQIGQDFQDLGTGIKDTFSRIIPGK